MIHENNLHCKNLKLHLYKYIYNKTKLVSFKEIQFIKILNTSLLSDFQSYDSIVFPIKLFYTLY